MKRNARNDELVTPPMSRSSGEMGPFQGSVKTSVGDDLGASIGPVPRPSTWRVVPKTE